MFIIRRRHIFLSSETECMTKSWINALNLSEDIGDINVNFMFSMKTPSSWFGIVRLTLEMSYVSVGEIGL